MKHLRLLITGIVLSLTIITGCDQNENLQLDEGKGRIYIHLTDAPFPIDLVSNAYVTIDKIEIRKQTANVEAGEDSFILISDKKLKVDLLELTNGITEQIATADLDAGSYNEIRLRVLDATLILNDGQEYDLKIPSGYTSGIKVKFTPEISLTEGQTSDVLLDFDVSKSFVAKGNINGNIEGFNFKPVVRGVFMEEAGNIEGNVSDSLGFPLENVHVKAWKTNDYYSGDKDEKSISAFTDIYGNYKLIGLNKGKYIVAFELNGFKKDAMGNFSIRAKESTIVDTELNEIEN